MKHFTFTRSIGASREEVFHTVADIDQFARAIPQITDVEILSDVDSGVGTRFRETREWKGRQMSTELEVTEYVDGERVRVISESGGTLWDSVYTVSSDDGRTRLRLVMVARPRNILARLVNIFIARMVKSAIERDMDAVKAYCEAGRAKLD